MKKTLTLSQQKALQIIKDHPGIGANGFAKLMWPDSIKWKNHTKKGHGSHRGGGMAVAGGCYVGKLKRLGWVRDSYKSSATDFSTAYDLTTEGERILNENSN